MTSARARVARVARQEETELQKVSLVMEKPSSWAEPGDLMVTLKERG